MSDEPGRHAQRTRRASSPSALASATGRRVGLALWSVVCVVLGLVASRWAPALVPGAERLLGVGQMSAIVSPAPCGDFLVAADDTATMPLQHVLAESIGTPPVALHQLGVAAYQLATFNVTLMPVIDETMTVTDVEIVEFDRRPAQVAWAMGRTNDCGGELYERGYSAHLDHEPITMQSDENPKTGESVGFTVSLDDPAELGITIRGCDGMYEFGLEFHYRVRGTASVVRVGTEDAPLRLLGGEPAHDPQVVVPRDDVFQVTADAAATLCEGSNWDAYVEPEDGEVLEEPVENPAPIDPDTLTDDDAFAEWEQACALLQSTLTPIEHMSFGCAPGEDQAAWEAACIKAEPVLSRKQLALFCSGAR